MRFHVKQKTMHEEEVKHLPNMFGNIIGGINGRGSLIAERTIKVTDPA